MDDAVFDEANDALSRMKRAYQRGTGCRLTPEMIQSLGVSLIGQIWNDDDPRPAAQPQSNGE